MFERKNNYKHSNQAVINFPVKSRLLQDSFFLSWYILIGDELSKND